jgi:hypothetical protein
MSITAEKELRTSSPETKTRCNKFVLVFWCTGPHMGFCDFWVRSLSNLSNYQMVTISSCDSSLNAFVASVLREQHDEGINYAEKEALKIHKPLLKEDLSLNRPVNG